MLGVAMKIYMRPPLPPMLLPPPPKAVPTPFELEKQAEELTKASLQQQARLKKLFGERKNPGDPDEDADLEKQQRGHHSKRNLDLLA
jgi:hypothetical protein